MSVPDHGYMCSVGSKVTALKRSRPGRNPCFYIQRRSLSSVMGYKRNKSQGSVGVDFDQFFARWCGNWSPDDKGKIHLAQKLFGTRIVDQKGLLHEGDDWRRDHFKS